MTDVITEPGRSAEFTPEAAPPRRRPGRRRVRLIAWFLVAALIVGVAGTGLAATWFVRRSFPPTHGDLTVAGLREPVRVARDALGVPQLYAANAHDLFLAQGYVHAQDRFWEMDVRRHITSGRLAELFGEGQVETDALIRTMGWRRVAEQELPLLSPTTRANLAAYAEGVNRYLDGRGGARLSVEHGLLGLTGVAADPEPWTEADSVAWLKAMAWDLNGSMADQLRRALLNASLPPGQVDDLFPDYDHERWPVVVDGGTGTATPERPERPARAARTTHTTGTAALRATAEATTRLDATLGPRGRAIGSNAWVVAGSRTTTGRPLLANDPHLAPSVPGVWYQVGLHCTTVGPQCPYDVAGFSFAGMPGVVIGHNARVAWGFTNLGPADTDLYLERVTGDRYEYRGEQLPLQTRTEIIEVAGGQPRTLTVRSTRHGPIVSDVHERSRLAGDVGRSAGVTPQPGGYAVALRWTALEPRNTLDALFGMNTATDWASFRAAAAAFAAPSQNLLYADTDGHIGYQAPGLIPVRARGDGSQPVPGWTGEYEWTGYVPFADLPTAYDPPQGYLVSANNAVVGPGYRYPLTTEWGDGFRAKRITDLIEQGGRLDAEAMGRIQNDSWNPMAESLVPLLLAVRPGADATAAQALLRDWDGSQPVDSAPAAYFNAVFDRVLELAFEAKLADTPAGIRPDGGGRWMETVRRVLDRPDDPWWHNDADPRGLRTRDDVLRAALDDAAADLRDRLGSDPRAWRWGDLHQLTLRNDTLGTGGPAPVQRLLNRGPFPVAGGSSAVNATGWDAKTDDYAVNWVPSMRMVVNLADLDDSRWINLTGASGHTYSEHYDDQLPLWLAGRTVPWSFTEAAVRRTVREALTLRPR